MLEISLQLETTALTDDGREPSYRTPYAPANKSNLAQHQLGLHIQTNLSMKSYEILHQGCLKSKHILRICGIHQIRLFRKDNFWSKK